METEDGGRETNVLLVGGRGDGDFEGMVNETVNWWMVVINVLSNVWRWWEEREEIEERKVSMKSAESRGQEDENEDMTACISMRQVT